MMRVNYFVSAWLEKRSPNCGGVLFLWLPPVGGVSPMDPGRTFQDGNERPPPTVPVSDQWWRRRRAARWSSARLTSGRAEESIRV